MPSVDYDALAKKFGGVDSAPSVDYDSLAAQFGGMDSDAPTESTDAGPQGYVANAVDALANLPAGIARGIWDEVLAPSGRKINEGIATLKEGDSPLLGIAQVLASVPGAEYVAGLSGKASQAVAEARQGNGSGAAVNAAQAIPGVQSGMAMQRRFYDRAAQQFAEDPNIKIASNALGELHGNLAGYALLDAAPGAVKATSGAVAPRLSKSLRESANKSYERVLGATTKDNKRVASQVAPELVDRGVVAPTRNSLYEKMNAKAEQTKINLDEALAKVPEDLRVDLAKADARLEGLKDQHLIKGRDGTSLPANEAAASSIDAISRLQADLRNLDPSFGSVRKFRQILDKQITAGNKSFGRTIKEGSALDVTREGANAIRAVLAESEPSIAALNKELSFWLKAKDVLGDTIQRTASQANPLGKTILEGAVTAGSLGQGGGFLSSVGVGKLAGMVKSIFDSTGWRTASATVKGRLANALMDGDVRAVGVIGDSLGARPPVAPIPPNKLPPVLPDPVIPELQVTAPRPAPKPRQAEHIAESQARTAAKDAANEASGAETVKNLQSSVELFKEFPKMKGESSAQWMQRITQEVNAKAKAPTSAGSIAEKVKARVLAMKAQGMSRGQMKASVIQDILPSKDGYKPADVQRMVDLILKGESN